MNVATETDRNLRAAANALLTKSNAALRKLLSEQADTIAKLSRRLAEYENAEARQAFDMAERASHVEEAAALLLREPECAALVADNLRLRAELDALRARLSEAA